MHDFAQAMKTHPLRDSHPGSYTSETVVLSLLSGMFQVLKFTTLVLCSQKWLVVIITGLCVSWMCFP